MPTSDEWRTAAERKRRNDLINRHQFVDYWTERTRNALDRPATLGAAVRSLPTKPQVPFEEWFWERCQRLGIEEEFRAKFEEWKRSHATNRPPTQ